MSATLTSRTGAIQADSKIKNSIQAFVCAVELDAEHSAAWTDLGQLYEINSRFEDALTCYKQAVKFNPGEFSPPILSQPSRTHSLDNSLLISQVDFFLRVSAGTRLASVLSFSLAEMGQCERAFGQLAHCQPNAGWSAVSQPQQLSVLLDTPGSSSFNEIPLFAPFSPFFSISTLLVFCSLISLVDAPNMSFI